MGKRKQPKLCFVQGNCLAEELAGSSDDGDEPGGLHIGGIVIRAPARSRAAEQPGGTSTGGPAAAPGGSSRAAHTRTQPKQLQQQENDQLLDSEGSLDDELRDYLDNVEQHDEDSSTDSGQDKTAAACPSSRGHTAAAAAMGSSSVEDWGDSRPGLGFAGLSAAARFAAVSLDDALEGNLGRDMQQGSGSSSSGDDSLSSPSSSSGGDHSDSDSDGSSSGEDPAHQVDGACLDASAAVVVDAQGQPMAAWESLPLQQRFPVQTRATAVAGEAGSRKGRGSSSSNRRSKHQQLRREPPGTNSVRAGLAQPVPQILPPDMPAYECDATTAAVEAAYAAAFAAAEMESAQRQQRRQQQKSLAKGAQRGRLLPGEKQQLRKEKIAAKRSERRDARGQGATALLAAVERFALGGGDMEVLPPCGKHKQAFVRSVAKLFGVCASAKGGSSSGRTCLMLASTPEAGPPAADAALQLQLLLTAELTRELTAAPVAAGAHQQHAAAAAAAGAAGQQGGNARRKERRALQQRGSSGAAAESAFQQPVAFVSGGTLDPNDSSTVVDNSLLAQQAFASTVLPPTAAAAAAAAIVEPAGPDDVGAAAAVPKVMPPETAAGHGAAGNSSARTAAASANVGTFLDSLLLDNDGQLPTTLSAAAEAANSPPPPAEAASGHLNQPHHHHQQQQQQQQQEQQDNPAWMEDRDPCWPVGAAGLGFPGQASPAAVPAAGKRWTVTAAASAPVPAPLYDKAPVCFGLGFNRGLGLSQQQQGVAQQQLTHVSVADTRSAAAATAAAAAGPSSRPGSQQLQALEDKFAALKTAPNPAAARRQQRKQQQQQQQRRQQQEPKLEARLAAPNTSLGPVIAAAALSPLSVRATAADGTDESGEEGSAGLVVTLGLTAQQVKRAQKQQLRNQRRSHRAAAADGPSEAAPTAAAAGNVHGGFAGFEAHTRGIGSRLMAGWGWREGEGLGRARQGRPEPLQAVRRERQLGLGAQ